MSASSPDDTNSITEPTKIVPVTTKVDGLSADFTRTFPPYSITVLQMKGKWGPREGSERKKQNGPEKTQKRKKGRDGGEGGKGGDLEDQNGAITSSNAIALLVVDTSGLGLAGLTNLAPNSSLSVGSQLTDTGGTAVAQIIGKFVITDSSGQDGLLGAAVSGLALDPPLATGQNLWLLWFPALTSSSTQPGNGTYFGVYRDPNTTPIDGGQPWVIPSDGSTVDLNALSPSEGGNTSQSDLAAKYRTIGSSSGGSNYTVVAGSYSGLVQSNTPSSGTTGFINITLANTGSFSAKLTFGGALVAFKGQFDNSGDYSTSLVTKLGTALSITLHAESVNGTDRITGTVSSGSSTSDLIANRSVFNSATNPATQFQGYYTLLLPPDSAATDFPQGNGYGTLTVDAGGTIKLKGVLGDGTKIKQTAVVSEDGSWPVYIPLYANKGVLSGWVTFTNIVGVSDLSGTLTWAKPAQSTAKLYPNGFTGTINAQGSHYTPPPVGTPALIVSNAACNVLFTAGEGNLSSFLSNSVTLDVANKVSPCIADGSKLKIIPATGLFSGSFLNPVTHKTTKFGGALSQKQNLGAGFFLGVDQSGFVTLEPAP